jgi:hypothetical protein
MSWLWGNDGLTFGDFMDVVNPLQHVPVVATVYRAFSGDTIAAGPRLLGGTLFGGVIGLGTAAANAFIETFSGKDIGAHVLALLHNPAPAVDQPVALANVAPSTSLPVAPSRTARTMVLPTSLRSTRNVGQAIPVSSMPPQTAVTAKTNQERTHPRSPASATHQQRLTAARDTYAWSRALFAARTGMRINTKF